jgi:CDP-2,3-bis-(O-geranylgeranyl)-sn-glycerol synthase
VVHDLLFALWFFFPAAIANVTPIFMAAVPQLKKFDAPMDFGKTFRGKRLLGSHKTWRGFISGMLFATLALWLQQLAVMHWGWAQDLTREVDYVDLPTLVLGPLFTIVALGGDAIERFFKSQRGVAPGKGWFPCDQLDYIIGGAIATMPFVTLSLFQYTWLIFLWLIIHLVSCYIGWLLHLKEHPI